MKKHVLRLRLVLCLSLSLLLTGCGPNEYQQRILDAANAGGQSTAEAESAVQMGTKDLLARYQDTAETDEEAAVLSQGVLLSPEGLSAMEAAVDELVVVYPFSDLSGVENAYQRYQTLPGYQGAVEHDIGSNLPLAPEKLFEIVKANNTNYITNINPILKKFQLEDDYILWACEIICDTINRELPALGSTTMLADVDANLADLKIFKPPAAGMANASVTDDNCMYISPVMVQNMVDLFGEDADVEVIVHETEHIIQKLSTETCDGLSVERGYGFCVSWEDQSVNSLDFNWFVEASAEKLATSLLEMEPITYKKLIGYLDTLTFLNILRGNAPKETPGLTQQSSLDRIFQLFGCETESERLELLEMLYAIELFQEEPDDFMVLYAKRLGHEASEAELTKLEIELKNAACQTTAKYFYRNLSRLLTENQMTLREVFYLITVFESDLNLHISYSDESRSDAIRPFLESFVSLQQTFFDGLAEVLDLTPEELHEDFTAFHCRTEMPKDTVLHGKAEWKSLSIEPLNQEANDFLYSFSRSVLIKKTVPIQTIVELLFG